MSFEIPAAFWALTSLLLLVIFSLWRQAAVRTIVPSVLLWKKIPERNPPIRALRRPKWRFELLFQAAAIAAAVAALAVPFLTTQTPKPRKIAFVFDTSARMQSGGRIEKAKAEAKRLQSEKLANDQVALYAAVPSPQRLGGIDEVRGIDAHVDLEPLLAAARQEAEHVVVFTDRPVPGAHTVLSGADPGNVGIVEMTATDEEVFVRVVTHGAPRPVPIRLEWDGKKVEATLPPAPESGWFHKGDFSKAPEIRVEIVVSDSFLMDNVARATRLGASRMTVAVGGTDMPLLRRALGAIPGVAVRGEGDALLSIGVDQKPAPARFSVWLHSPTGRFQGRVEVVHHPLTEGLEGREGELGPGGVVGELPPEARAGEALLKAGGRVIAALMGNTLHVAIDLAPKGWASTPSFPIFWKNVVDFAGKRGSAPAVVRTGQLFPMPSEATEVVRTPAGALWSLSPGGRFVAYTRGEYGFRTAGGEGRIEANLLDARESDAAGMTRALDWEPGNPSGREFVRRLLSGWAAALSLVLVVAAWMLQRRSD
jgi:hypothetical protein